MALAFLAAASAVPAAAQNSGPREITVTMDNMVFGSMPSDAKVGDTIVWVNNDTVQHTATARDGSFDVRLQPGQRGKTVLKKAGNMAIYCIYHPMMRTTLRIAAS
jgi:plastocyanin